jgi:Flp pilus assembly pilin Flp
MTQLFINALVAVRGALDIRPHSERGASMVEYALLVGLIAVVSVVIVTALGQSVFGIFSNANSAI